MIQIYQKLGKGMSRVDMPPISSISELFTNIDRLLPEIEQRAGGLENIFYTLNESGHGDREFERFTHFAFDIDHADTGRWEDYHQAVARILQVERKTVTAVISGHGLHFLIEVTAECQFTDVSLFPKKKLQYRKICSMLEEELKKLGLAGKVDSSIFDRARIMRMPGTMNVKPNKDPVPARLAFMGEYAAHLDMTRLSGIEIHDSPTKPKKEKNSDSITWHGANDDNAILEGCEAIKFAQTKPKQVDEPMWYALDSIVGRLKGGKALLHEWAKARPDYEEAAVEGKINQALEQSGPRTCQSIEGLWDGCKTCKNYKKVTSPIQIQGPDFIATETTGFHKQHIGANGQLVLKPAYEDLFKFFKKKIHFQLIAESREVRGFTGGVSKHRDAPGGKAFYEVLPPAFIEAFAQQHFRPFAETKMTREFLNLIQRSELVSAEWFKDSTENKLNLLNGVYLIKERRLVPHSPEFGFMSQLQYNWDPTATCPTFDKFMADITCGDTDLEEAIIQFLAYAISGSKCYNAKILILTGEGSNGKSTLLDIVYGLFGKSVENFQSEEINKQFDRQRLEGKLAAVLEEMPSFKDRAFWEQMKNLSAGGKVSVAKKYHDPRNIINRAKFIITCNVLPGGTDPSHGFFRRLLIVPFNARFSAADGTKDAGIGDRIVESELPGVLNRLIAAHERLLANDYELPEPDASRMALGQYMLDRDPVLAWFDEHLRAATPGELELSPGELGRHDDYGQFNEMGFTFTALTVTDNPVPCLPMPAAYQHFKSWSETRETVPSMIAPYNTFSARLKTLLKAAGLTWAQRRVEKRKPIVILGVVPKWFGDSGA